MIARDFSNGTGAIVTLPAPKIREPFTEIIRDFYRQCLPFSIAVKCDGLGRNPLYEFGKRTSIVRSTIFNRASVIAGGASVVRSSIEISEFLLRRSAAISLPESMAPILPAQS